MSGNTIKLQKTQPQKNRLTGDDLSAPNESAEKALQKSEERYSQIVSSIPGAVYQFVKNKQGQFFFPYISEAIEGLIGIKAEVLTQDANKMFDYIHPDDHKEFLTSIERSAKSMTMWEQDFRVINPDKKILWIKGRSNPSLRDNGDILWNGVLIDTTERKQIEEKLGERNRLTQIILDSLPFPAMLIRKDRVVVAANKVARNVGAKVGSFCWRDFGQTDYIPREDKEYINLHNCLPESGTKCTFCLADNTFAAGELQNNPEIHALGRIWDTYWIPVDNKIFLHFAIDVTERKQMERKLRKRTHDLAERVKELGCLYSISKLIQNPYNTYKDVLQGVIEIISNSCQYPEITCAKLTIENEEIKTDNFIETAWKISSKIIVSKEEIGLLEVVYFKKQPLSNKESFLKEEKALIDAITERLGQYIERKRAEDALNLTNEKLIIEQNALKEKNITLKEVLNQIEKEKQQIAVQTQSNVDRVLMPILNKLEEKMLSENRIYATLLRNSLEEITHPFINNVETRFSKLAPREIEICNMIRNGLSSKEIASALNTSVGTVFNQRKTIRKKLGIANDDINLSSFLHTSQK